MLAAPKFLGYTQDAKNAQVKADIKTYENVVTAQLTKNPMEFEKWFKLEPSKISEIETSGKLKNRKAEVVSELPEGLIYIVNNEYTKKTKGSFLWAEATGEVFYYPERLLIEEEITMEEIPVPGPGEAATPPSYNPDDNLVLTPPAD